jgi:hypothetical protein
MNCESSSKSNGVSILSDGQSTPARPDNLDGLIEQIFEIAETHGSDYQTQALRHLLVEYITSKSAVDRE